MIRAPKLVRHGAPIVLGVGILAALMSPDPGAVFASFASLSVIVLALWTRDEPPLLLLPALVQWSQVALVPISTVWLGRSMLDVSRHGGATGEAALYGLLGVTALGLGLRYGSRLRGRNRHFLANLYVETVNWPSSRIFLLSYTAIFTGYLSSYVDLGGGAREILNQLGNIKFAGLFMLSFWCLANRRNYALLALTVMFDVLIGMTGFFAEFKDTVLVVAIAALAAQFNPKTRDIVAVMLAVTVVVGSAIFWSAIKPEYRSFVNLGTGQQIIRVPLADRIDFLIDRMAEFDGDDLMDGFEALVARHGYTEFLGLTLQNVPAVVPHENGKLTVAAVRHVTMPRLLFPSKPPVPHDTDIMVKYTGLPALWNRSTSISIGYLGELYVDFGWVGGLVAAFVLGGVAGWFYAIIRDHRRTPCLINACLGVIILIPLSYFGTAYIKVVGGLVFAIAITIMTQRFMLPMVFWFTLRQARRSQLHHHAGMR